LFSSNNQTKFAPFLFVHDFPIHLQLSYHILTTFLDQDHILTVNICPLFLSEGYRSLETHDNLIWSHDNLSSDETRKVTKVQHWIFSLLFFFSMTRFRILGTTDDLGIFGKLMKPSATFS
jgi:hypothetical protein